MHCGIIKETPRGTRTINTKLCSKMPIFEDDGLYPLSASDQIDADNYFESYNYEYYAYGITFSDKGPYKYYFQEGLEKLSTAIRHH